jgi:hypothetical protein
MGLQHSPDAATKEAAGFEQQLRAHFGQNINIRSYGHHVQIRNYISENKTLFNAGWTDFGMAIKVEDPLYELDKLTLAVQYENGVKEHISEGIYGLSELLNKKWLEEQRAAKLAAMDAGKSYYILKLPKLDAALAFLENAYGIRLPVDSRLYVTCAVFDAGAFKGVPSIPPSDSVRGGLRGARRDGKGGAVGCDDMWG